MSSDSIPASPAEKQEEVHKESFPIAQTATKDDTQSGQPEKLGEQRPNKYVYEEFAGYDGERYLETLMQQILPQALWRTWWYAVGFQAPGNACYVGTTRLASRVKPGVRKIELDFAELEARGLMHTYADRLPMVQEDGSIRYQAVRVKDFRKLYDLAHEYHLWQRSPEYIPAERGYRELIVANLKLLAKLIRFDCYRRFIECAKPGRKSQAKPAHTYYHCSQQTAEAPWQGDSQEATSHTTSTPSPQNEENHRSTNPRTDGLNANLYLNTSENISSAYRRSENSQDLQRKDSHSSDYEGNVAEKAIGNTKPQLELVIETTGTKNTEEHETILSNPKSKTPTPQKGNSPARAIDVKEYNIEELKQNPYALAAVLAEMYEQSQQSPKPVKQQPQQDRRPQRGTPEPLARKMAHYAQQLGGNPKYLQSDVTRVTKLYWTATQIYPQFKNSWFEGELAGVFQKACKRGVKNRVAFFFTCLENRLQLTPDEHAYILSDEPLYKDGVLNDFIDELRRQYARSGSTLEYNAWVKQEILKEQPKS